MKTSKLLKLLHFLKPKEQNELDKHIKPSLKNIKKLYGMIRKAKFEAAAPSLEKAKVWQQLFGKKKKFNNQYLGDIMSKLSKIVEKFMTEKQFEKDENHQNYLLLKALKERGAKASFLLYYDNITADLERQISTSNTFYYEYLHKKLLHEFATLNQDMKIDIGFWEVLAAFERYSLLDKLQYLCGILNEASVVKQSESERQKTNKMAENVKEQLPVFGEDAFIIELYAAVLQLQMSQSQDDFLRLKEMLFSEKDVLQKNDALFVATTASNFCSRMIISGKEEFYAEMFAIYQYKLQEALLEIDGFINPRYVKNTVTLGLKAKKFEWVKDFIEGYKEKVMPKWSDSVYHFNLGVYFFYRKDYQKALQYLCLIERFDVFFELDYRILMLKIYYELAETFAFNDLLLSFRKYIDRQTHLPKNKKISYYNFLKWSKLLFMQKAKKQAVEQKSLDELKTTNLLAERKWLLEKASIL